MTLLKGDSLNDTNGDTSITSLNSSKPRPKKYLKMRKKKKPNPNSSYGKLAKIKKKKKKLIDESRKNLSSFISKSMVDAPSKPKPDVSFTNDFRASIDKTILSNLFFLIILRSERNFLWSECY
jgi:hypothetical protein